MKFFDILINKLNLKQSNYSKLTTICKMKFHRFSNSHRHKRFFQLFKPFDRKLVTACMQKSYDDETSTEFENLIYPICCLYIQKSLQEEAFFAFYSSGESGRSLANKRGNLVANDYQIAMLMKPILDMVDLPWKDGKKGIRNLWAAYSRALTHAVLNEPSCKCLEIYIHLCVNDLKMYVKNGIFFEDELPIILSHRNLKKTRLVVRLYYDDVMKLSNLQHLICRWLSGENYKHTNYTGIFGSDLYLIYIYNHSNLRLHNIHNYPSLHPHTMMKHIQFDPNLGKLYLPRNIPKHVELVRYEISNTFSPHSGGIQYFSNNWFKIQDSDNKCMYGVDARTFLETHTCIGKNLYIKTSPVLAYRIFEYGLVDTLTSHGFRECSMICEPGNWIVKQNDREVYCISTTEMKKRYYI